MCIKKIVLTFVLISFASTSFAGREVRMVPEGWEHPKDKNGYYIPLFDGVYYKENLAEWDLSAKMFAEGLQTDFEGGWYPLEDEYKSMSYEEYDGSRPIAEDYMPNWDVRENIMFMMYETTTEGTPLSPAFKKKEELAHWLAETKASAFGNYTATYEEWLSMIEQSNSVPSIVITPSGVNTGVSATLKTN